MNIKDIDFKYYSIFIICAVIIVLYGLFRCYHPGFSDPFAKSFISNKKVMGFFDGWAFLHLFFYMFVTILYPNKWIQTSIIGVLWELIELSSKERPFYMPKCFYLSKNDSKEPWWYGRYEDIIMNSIGIFIGYYINLYYIKK
jgi:hypothetical protein